MTGHYTSIKDWAENERPREKLYQQGAEFLSVTELMAILLRSGAEGESAHELARRIMADNKNNLNILARKGVKELINKYKGIGIAKAATIVAAMEISRRRQPEENSVIVSMTCSQDVYLYIRPFVVDLDHEEFWVIYLTHANAVKGCSRLSSGGMDGTVIDVRMLFRSALDMKATSIIVVHNHPGGTLNPSVFDEMITRKIYEGGLLLDIKLYDHIIVGDHKYFSFADEGLLNYVAKKPGPKRGKMQKSG